MWKTIRREAKKDTGDYYYVKVTKSRVSGGKILGNTTVKYPVDIVFVDLGNKLIKDENGDYIEGTSQGIITDKWCIANDVKPDLNDYITDVHRGETYRIQGLADYSAHEGIYLLRLSRDPHAEVEQL